MKQKKLNNEIVKETDKIAVELTQEQWILKKYDEGKNITILERNMVAHLRDGFKIYAYTDGLVSFAKQSNSGQYVIMCEKEHPDAEIIIVRGAKKRYATQGTKNAVLYK